MMGKDPAPKCHPPDVLLASNALQPQPGCKDVGDGSRIWIDHNVLHPRLALPPGCKTPASPRRGGEEAQLAHEQDLERHLLHAFFQMEMELVKLVTLVRNHKAALTLRHRGCRAPECQLARESAKAFNLVVFDIEEED